MAAFFRVVVLLPLSSWTLNSLPYTQPDLKPPTTLNHPKPPLNPDRRCP